MKKILFTLLCMPFLFAFCSVANAWMLNAVIGGHAAACADVTCAGFIVCQNFEGTGYDNSETWTEAGGGTKDEDYTTSPAPLRGSQSLYIEGTSTAESYIAIAGAPTELWGHFIWQTSDGQPASNATVAKLNGTTAIIYILTTGYLKISHGTSLATATTTQFANGAITPVRIWWHYKKSTGSDDGVMTVWVSSIETTTRPAASEVTLTSGKNTTSITLFDFFSGVTAMNNIYDQVLVSTTEFTTVCP